MQIRRVTVVRLSIDSKARKHMIAIPSFVLVVGVLTEVQGKSVLLIRNLLCICSMIIIPWV